MSFRMHRMPLVLSLIIALVGFAPNVKADLGEHEKIAQFLSSDIVLVGWLDIATLDMGDTAKLLEEATGNGPNEKDLKQLQAVRDALVELQVKKLYWLFDLASLPRGAGVMLIPTNNPEAVSLLLGSLTPPNSEIEFKQADGLVIAGEKEAVTAAGSRTSEPTKALVAAIENCKGEHGVAFATPPYVTMSAMNALKPMIEKDNVGELAQTAAALAGIEWTSASATSSLDMSLEVRTSSAESAEGLKALVARTVSKMLRSDGETLPFKTRKTSLVLETKGRSETIELLGRVRKIVAGPGSGTSSNHMKMIALALHNYAAANGHFPPQSLVDEDGNRLLSWRVLILPYLEQNALYNQFHLDEPWDSPHNIKLANTIPAVYASFAGLTRGDGAALTQMVAPITPQSTFGKPGDPAFFRDITDGTSNTIWFVEVSEDAAVVWSKPEDLTVDTETPLQGIVSDEARGFWASFVDGSVRYFSSELDPKVANAFFTINGGEVINYDDL